MYIFCDLSTRQHDIWNQIYEIKEKCLHKSSSKIEWWILRNMTRLASACNVSGNNIGEETRATHPSTGPAGWPLNLLQAPVLLTTTPLELSQYNQYNTLQYINISKCQLHKIMQFNCILYLNQTWGYQEETYCPTYRFRCPLVMGTEICRLDNMFLMFLQYVSYVSSCIEKDWKMGTWLVRLLTLLLPQLLYGNTTHMCDL